MFTRRDPIGMLAVFEYLKYLNGESTRLGGKKVPPLPRGHFSPRMMTVDARIVHKWVPEIRVEDFKVRISFFQTTVSWSEQHYKGLKTKLSPRSLT